MRHLLLLGGGGFIGSNFYEDFCNEFEKITIVDYFSGPAHSSKKNLHYLESILRTKDKILKLDISNLSEIDIPYHELTNVIILNADTGTGKSFEDPFQTINENLMNLVHVIQIIRNNCDKNNLIVTFTSSRAVYGEGKWACSSHGPQIIDRSLSKLKNNDFTPSCKFCDEELTLEKSDESDPLNPVSVYGASKESGEKLLALTLCKDGFDVRIIRYQNVFGTGQAIDNPYTGVINWFSSSFINNEDVNIYEQGLIVRDFIFIKDAIQLLFNVSTTKLNIKNKTNPIIVNGGSGEEVLLYDVAKILKNLLESKSKIYITNKFRVGDVLGAASNISFAKNFFKFQPKYTLEKSLFIFVDWFKKEFK